MAETSNTTTSPMSLRVARELGRPRPAPSNPMAFKPAAARPELLCRGAYPSQTGDDARIVPGHAPLPGVR